MEQDTFISQKDYRPTPFSLSQYEVVGERLTNLNFIPLEVPILHNEKEQVDPMFEVFDEGLPKHLESVTHYAAGELDSIGENAQKLLEEKHLKEMQIAVEQASAEGYQKGLTEAAAKTKDEYESKIKKLQEHMMKIDHDVRMFLQSLENKVEKNAVNLALSVSKKILATTAEVKPEYIYDVIRGGLTQLGAGKPLKIRVSPDDYEFITVVGLPVDLTTEESGVTYVLDENIQSGCVIETNFGEVDLQLDQMWDHIKESLFEVAGK